jgi:hypothetical protein
LTWSQKLPRRVPAVTLTSSLMISTTCQSMHLLQGPRLWQNQPELYRLKYASPSWRANSYFKRYNTIGLSGNVPINHRTQDPTRYLTRRWVQRYNAKIIYTTGRYITKIYKASLALIKERLLQNRFKFEFKAAEFEKRKHYTRLYYRCHASPGMTSFGGFCVGRGRIPFHGPTIRQRIRPWGNECGLLRRVTWSKSTKQGWVY